jgi:hypothetical protein
MQYRILILTLALMQGTQASNLFETPQQSCSCPSTIRLDHTNQLNTVGSSVGLHEIAIISPLTEQCAKTNTRSNKQQSCLCQKERMKNRSINELLYGFQNKMAQTTVGRVHGNAAIGLCRDQKKEVVIAQTLMKKGQSLTIPKIATRLEKECQSYKMTLVSTYIPPLPLKITA